MTFRNVYEDAARAEAYSRLEFPGTYFLAYRDLPEILSRHVAGRRAVDFGCGAGRSTRFLRRLGFEAVGLDISADMIRRAGEIDPSGDYRLVGPATSEIYTHEWASFSTRDFPENSQANSGDVVRIVMTDVTDRRPVEDIVCSKASYLEIYREAGLEVVASYEPLGREDERFAWVNETRVTPWRIDVLRRA